MTSKTVGIVLNCDYLEYRAAFEDRYGDVDEAHDEVLHHGDRVPCVIRRMTEAEFAAAVLAHAGHVLAFESALRAGDQTRMADALSAAFPFELQLLM